MRLSARLGSVAALAGTGESVIDVGTDHGYLPAYFALTGSFSRIAASDVRELPLAGARQTARSLGVEDRISFYLSDGLAGVPEILETVVIAGMGGETMAGILSACPWIASARLVLQPQSKLRELSACLEALDFGYEDACITQDGGKLYPAFSARRGAEEWDMVRALILRRDPLLGRWAGMLADRRERALEGLRGGADAASERAGEQEARLGAELRALRDIVKETEKW